MARTETLETASAPANTGSTLGVGIIRVNPAWGWAVTAHIPALRALPNYEIRALSARSPESARAAGEAFGIKAVFQDPEQLVIQPDLDVVAITVKVPHHRELVSAALAAGKAVYCEWPLGRDLDEARAMAALAAEKGVRTVVGLQARQAPAIEFVRQLLGDGYVGEVLSTTMVGLSVVGRTLVQPNAYMLDTPSLLSLRRCHRNGPRSQAWKERLPSTSLVPTPRSRQISTTGLTPCRTSSTPSGATKSSPPSRGRRQRGNA